MFNLLGVTNIMAVVIRAHTTTMTSKAITIPRQFLCCPELPTSSCKIKNNMYKYTSIYFRDQL